MSSNQPPFDPLNATDEEEADMLAGYRDGRADRPPPLVTSAAYDHGRRNGVNDRLKTTEPEMRELARRYLRGTPSRARLPEGTRGACMTQAPMPAALRWPRRREAIVNVERLPVDPTTCTVLGARVKPNSPRWTGLRWNGEETVLTQSTLMMVVCGADAPYDLHLRVPWVHPEDEARGFEADSFYRVRPIPRAGKKWNGRKVKSVAIERDETRSPPWAIVLEFGAATIPEKE